MKSIALERKETASLLCDSRGADAHTKASHGRVGIERYERVEAAGHGGSGVHVHCNLHSVRLRSSRSLSLSPIFAVYSTLADRARLSRRSTFATITSISFRSDNAC